jgi:hypothetical protein
MRLHSIPEALISTVFSQWLTMVDIARVDSAFCSKHQRPRLLQTAYSPGVVLQYTDDSGDKYNDALNKWIVTRGASVPCIYVTDFLHNAQPRKSYLERHGKTIHSAAIHPLTRQTWTSCKAAILDFVRYCPSPTKIDGASSLDCLGWLYIADRCPLLEEISNVHITPFSMAILARKSPLLRKVQFASDASVTDELMSALCMNAPLLEHFVHNDCNCSRFVTDNTMITIATHCRHLTVLDVDGRCLADASVSALAAHCRQLHTLCLHESSIRGRTLVQLTSVCTMRKLAFHSLSDLRPEDLDLILVNARACAASRYCHQRTTSIHAVALAEHAPSWKSCFCCSATRSICQRVAQICASSRSQAVHIVARKWCTMCSTAVLILRTWSSATVAPMVPFCTL